MGGGQGDGSSPSPRLVAGRIVRWWADVPPRGGNPTGLIEDAALGAGEGKVLVRIDAATLDLLPTRRGLHYVVPAVGINGHLTIVTRGTG